MDDVASVAINGSVVELELLDIWVLNFETGGMTNAKKDSFL